AADRTAAERGRGERVRPAVAGGGRDAVGAQPDLAPRRRGVLRAAVFGAHLDRQRRGDPAAHRRRARAALRATAHERSGARQVNMDETGWRLRGERRFLWGAFSARHAVLRIMGDRDADRVWQLLGNSGATVTSDRWWAYDSLPLRRRQVCWADLKRDF